MNDKLQLDGVKSKGFGIIPKLVMQDENLHIYAKAIYAYFCSYAGAGEICFPSRSKICFDLGISNDTLGKYINQIVKQGYISVEQVKENGKFSFNIYTLMDTISPCPKRTDTDDTVYGEVDTNNNSFKNNSYLKKTIKESKPKGFTPPTLQEIKDYCRERKNNIDAKKFYDYFTAGNWQDSKGNKVKNWKQKIITWEQNQTERTVGAEGNPYIGYPKLGG